METTVVNVRKSQYDVYIGRGNLGYGDGYFGNPFRLKKNQPRGATLERYRTYFYDMIELDDEFRERVHQLKGKRLGCFCKPNSCHGDIIASYLNNLK